MSKFIELSDYDASIHREILDALTREDDAVVEICEDRAVAEMRCYLSRRYDCDKIFTATGDKRNQLVLMMAIDIAVYHIFCIHKNSFINILLYKFRFSVYITRGTCHHCGRNATKGPSNGWKPWRPRRYRWTGRPCCPKRRGRQNQISLSKATVNV